MCPIARQLSDALQLAADMETFDVISVPRAGYCVMTASFSNTAAAAGRATDAVLNEWGCHRSVSPDPERNDRHYLEASIGK